MVPGAHKSLSRNKDTSVGLGLKEGLIAPFYASGVLFLMYCIIKYLPDLDLQAVIGECASSDIPEHQVTTLLTKPHSWLICPEDTLSVL